MKRIYITAIPLDSNFAIDSYAAEPVNYTQTLAKPTYYPITPILADTAHAGDEIKVIAVRQINSPHSENLEIFRRELDGLGLPYTLVDLTTPENQQRDGLLPLLRGLHRRPHGCRSRGRKPGRCRSLYHNVHKSFYISSLFCTGCFARLVLFSLHPFYRVRFGPC